MENGRRIAPLIPRPSITRSTPPFPPCPRPYPTSDQGAVHAPERARRPLSPSRRGKLPRYVLDTSVLMRGIQACFPPARKGQAVSDNPSRPIFAVAVITEFFILN